MAFGLSTYAYFWRLSDRVPEPMGLDAMLENTAELGGKVFQICDYPKIETLSVDGLEQLRQRAESLGVVLELGTRGLKAEHLERYLQLAQALNAKILRSMFNGPDSRPTLAEAQQQLAHILPAFERSEVALCIETYEQVPTASNLAVVKHFNSPWLGICLDPANCVAALETPKEVIASTAPYVLNLHVKDFAFSRRDGWVGFTFAGCPLGEGLLDYDAMIAEVKPQARGINQIIEHWLPWQEDAASTCALEDAWTRHNLEFLLSRQS
ncbi:MAG: sugar phosphate isomerase/epimerase family protein [Rouxiella badensis]|uniref:sugar phosphate isomerase/epimerase family protein n=1 Tax=Rouxiella badensis TaxID=1646377 RepID=UPI003C6546D9